MSQSVIHRGKRGVGYLPGGTQYIVNGSLDLSNPMTIVLKNSIFSATGQYILFNYANGGSWTGSLSNVAFDTSDLPLSSFGSLVDDPAQAKIILTLQSRDDNGMQVVLGDLDVSAGSMTVVMKKSLYKTAGTYKLFYFPNGMSLIGSVSNISVTPPAGRSVAVAPYVDGNYIKVTLA